MSQVLNSPMVLAASSSLASCYIILMLLISSSVGLLCDGSELPQHLLVLWFPG